MNDQEDHKPDEQVNVEELTRAIEEIDSMTDDFAQLQITVVANRVSKGRFRTDEEMRKELRHEGDIHQTRAALELDERALALLKADATSDSLTPQIEAYLRRRIAMTKEIPQRCSGRVQATLEQAQSNRL